MPTGQVTYAMALKLSLDIILLLKVHGFEGFSNRNQIDRIVSNHLSIDVIRKFTTIENIATDCSQLLVVPTSQTTTLKPFQTPSFC